MSENIRVDVQINHDGIIDNMFRFYDSKDKLLFVPILDRKLFDFAEVILPLLEESYEEGKDELRGFFRIEELKLIIDIFCENIRNAELVKKQQFIEFIKYKVQVDTDEENHEIEQESFLAKVMELKSFQCLLIQGMIYEYQGLQNDKSVKYDLDLIKEIFM